MPCQDDHARIDRMYDGGKVYTLKADGAAKAELDKLAGKMADVTGDVNGTTVMVKSVKMAKTKK